MPQIRKPNAEKENFMETLSLLDINDRTEELKNK